MIRRYGMRMLIKNVRIVSPGNGLDRIGDIAVSDGTILRVGECAEPEDKFDTVIDGRGLVAAPEIGRASCRERVYHPV